MRFLYQVVSYKISIFSDALESETRTQTLEHLLKQEE